MVQKADEQGNPTYREGTAAAEGWVRGGGEAPLTRGRRHQQGSPERQGIWEGESRGTAEVRKR